MPLRDFLKQQYEKQGWTVYSDFFDVKNSIPGGWTGIFPDFIAAKGSHREAVCIESESGLRGEHAPVKWKTILRNPDVSLKVVVRDKPSFDLVVQTAERYGIKLECRIMKRSERKKRKNIGRSSVLRNRMSLFVMMITIVMVFIVSFLFFPAMRKKAELQADYYRPMDIERQLKTLEKEKNKLPNK